MERSACKVFLLPPHLLPKPLLETRLLTEIGAATVPVPNVAVIELPVTAKVAAPVSAVFPNALVAADLL